MGLFGNAIQGTVFPFKSSRAQTVPFAGNLQNREKSQYLFVFPVKFCL